MQAAPVPSVVVRSAAPASAAASAVPEIKPGAESGLEITPKAIEMGKKAIARRTERTFGLRLGVRGGGCSGASYAIEFADKARAKDHVFDFDGLSVVIDPKSLLYLRGSVLDYEFKLMEHGFRFRNPNAKSGCGCGESFSV